MKQLRNWTALALVLSCTCIFAAPEAARVVCVSSTSMTAGCDGVLQRLDQALFLKRWPSGYAIVVTTQQVRPKSMKLAVNVGTLHVVKVVTSGNEIGTRPVWFAQADDSTTNLSDGAPADVAAKNIGSRLAEELNKAIASGATADK